MEDVVKMNEQLRNLIIKHTAKHTVQEGLKEILKNEINRKAKKYMIQIRHYESKYAMNFSDFEESHKNHDMPYQVEKDYFEWDMAVTMVEDLNEELKVLNF